MKGFQYQQVGGLFTFYREQAEHQQRRQQQKQEKALKKKQKQQAEQQRKQQQAKQKQKQQQLKQQSQKDCKQKYANSLHNTELRQDYTEKAKKYIKQLQQNRHNKLMFDHRKRMRRYNNLSNFNRQLQEGRASSGNKGEGEKKQEDAKSKQKDKQRKINDEMHGLFSLQQSQIFANKKDFAKFNYMMLFDKEVVAPKQFNSIQIFDTVKHTQITVRHYSLQLLHNKPKQNLNRLPKIHNQNYDNIHPSLSQLKKDPKKSMNIHYNPMDIILNNQKFKIAGKNSLNNGNRDRNTERSDKKIGKKYEVDSLRYEVIDRADPGLVDFRKIKNK